MSTFIIEEPEPELITNQPQEKPTNKSLLCKKDFTLSFGIPQKLMKYNPNKTRNFAQTVLHNNNLYKLQCTEEEYWKNYIDSRFVIITCENNREDPRIYEALACNCIPIIYGLEDIDTSPTSKYSVIDEFLELDGLDNGMIDEYFEEDKYVKLLVKMNYFSTKYLTTDKVASSFLKQINVNGVESVLFLSWCNEKEDYELTASFLHGLKDHLGHENVVDFPKVNWMYDTRNKKRDLLPRGGYMYGYCFPQDDKTDRSNIEKRIKEKEFDLIIVSGIFTSNSRKKLRIKLGEFLYSNLIFRYYDSHEIIFLDAHDCPSETEEGVNSFKNMGIIVRR